MKLLIVAQKVDVNDDILGFFHRWIEEFAGHCEKVTVICLQKGEYHLPKNVRVLSLGKEEKRSRLQYLARFYKYIWQERNNYDAVFVHMNPEYVVLGGLFWRFWKKKIALWYTHKSVNLKLKIAEKLADKIFTASVESFRLPSEKVSVMGHGIDVDEFKPIIRKRNDIFRIITVGRISPIKRYETLIDAVEIIAHDNFSCRIDIVGGAVSPGDLEYAEYLSSLALEKDLGKTVFFTHIPRRDIPGFVAQADLFVNMSETGSIDKAVLEAMACGAPVLTSNEAFEGVFGDEADTLMFPKRDARSLAKRIKEISMLSDDSLRALGERLRSIITERHNVKTLIPRIIHSYETDK